MITWSLITGDEQKKVMRENLSKNYDIIDLTYDEMFTGSSLGIEWQNEDGVRGFLISKTADEAMPDELRGRILKYFDKIISVDLLFNEKVGGSSLECLTQPIPLF